jgi:hypothetical protein
MAAVINTVRDHHERGYSINCFCTRCRHRVACSLARLIMRGKGDKPVSEIRIKHACGPMVEMRRSRRTGRRCRAG